MKPAIVCFDSALAAVWCACGLVCMRSGVHAVWCACGLVCMRSGVMRFGVHAVWCDAVWCACVFCSYFLHNNDHILFLHVLLFLQSIGYFNVGSF